MTAPLEKRLQAHLGADASAMVATDDAGLDTIKKRARRRSLQTRVAAGAFGLAALAGLASLVPTSDTADSLITATQPTPMTQQVDDDAAATATPEVAGTPVDAPQPSDIVADGQGGFVALDRRTSDGQNFVRSIDGENWFSAEQTQLPVDELDIDRLRFQDGRFVLDLHIGGNNDPADGSLALGVSEDLDEWQVIVLGLSKTESTGLMQIRRQIGEIAINGDDIAAVITEFKEIDDELVAGPAESVCGLVEEQEALSVLLCGGTTFSPPGLERPEVVQRVVVSRSGTSATPLSTREPEDPRWNWSAWRAYPIAEGDSFTVLDSKTDLAAIAPVPIADRLIELGDPRFLAAKAADGQTLVLADAGGQLVTMLAPDANANVALLPDNFEERAVLSNALYRIDHGPAGWVITVVEQGSALVEFERNGWQFLGLVGLPDARVRATDGSEQISFESATSELPPGVQHGLFGGVRYFHPVTGELLMELSREEFASSTIDSTPVDQATFDRTVEIDGWTVGGHPLLGPLRLTSPSGVLATYDDGFAFNNDDTSDGVEAHHGLGAFVDFSLERAGTISFYDDAGTEFFSVEGLTLFRELVAPVLAEMDESPESTTFSPPPLTRNHSFVLHSQDGSAWDLLWASDDIETVPHPYVINVAVGDDEILIGTSNELTRVPIEN